MATRDGWWTAVAQNLLSNAIWTALAAVVAGGGITALIAWRGWTAVAAHIFEGASITLLVFAALREIGHPRASVSGAGHVVEWTPKRIEQSIQVVTRYARVRSNELSFLVAPICAAPVEAIGQVTKVAATYGQGKPDVEHITRRPLDFKPGIGGDTWLTIPVDKSISDELKAGDPRSARVLEGSVTVVIQVGEHSFEKTFHLRGTCDFN